MQLLWSLSGDHVSGDYGNPSRECPVIPLSHLRWWSQRSSLNFLLPSPEMRLVLNLLEERTEHWYTSSMCTQPVTGHLWNTQWGKRSESGKVSLIQMEAYSHMNLPHFPSCAPLASLVWRRHHWVPVPYSLWHGLHVAVLGMLHPCALHSFPLQCDSDSFSLPPSRFKETDRDSHCPPWSPNP